jgi:hypothetical protein
MIVYRSIIAGTLSACCVSASAQVQSPVPGAAIAKRAITEEQTHKLSQTFATRPVASTLNVDPNKVTAAAGPQAPVVNVSGSKVVAAATSGVMTPTSPATLQIVKTSPAEDKLLASAIAGKDQFRAALSSPASSLITLPDVVRLSQEGAPTLQVKPFIFVNQPLQRDNATGMYKGELLIGVAEIADTGVTKQLPTPLLFQIVGAARSDPARILVDSTSPPFRPVDVWLSAAQGAKLLVVSMFDHAGTQIALPVASELDVDTGNGRIAGFGVESTHITVSLNNVADAPGRMVTLHVDPSGYLDQTKLTLDDKGVAETELRSGSIGTAQIRATSPGLAPISAIVTYTFPFLTIAASILGGLLGAGVSLFTTPGEGNSAMRRLLGASLYGILVFVAYVIGINLLPVTAKVSVGALATFAISALGAWVGPNVANFLAKR